MVSQINRSFTWVCPGMELYLTAFSSIIVLHFGMQHKIKVFAFSVLAFTNYILQSRNRYYFPSRSVCVVCIRDLPTRPVTKNRIFKHKVVFYFDRRNKCLVWPDVSCRWDKNNYFFGHFTNGIRAFKMYLKIAFYL